MNAAEFAAKWIGNTNTERSAAQEHFIDICMMLGVPTPNTDREGEAYAFEKGAGKTSGGKGWADVWLRGRFGWEYKGHHRDLEAAYKQLLNYREALENPPLLVVCDLDHFSIRTNFTNTIWHDYSFGVLYSHVHELWVPNSKADRATHLSALSGHFPFRAPPRSRPKSSLPPLVCSIVSGDVGSTRRASTSLS